MRFASCMKLFWRHFAVAIAALSATATLLTVLFDLDWIKDNWICGVVGAVVVLVGSLFYAIWQIKSKKEINLNLSSELKLTISEGDIFSKKGVICIPVNEFFDTHVGDGVISERSLHGRFINKFFKDRISELDSKINDQLKGTEYETLERRLAYCPNKRYPLGTCVDVRDGENLYVLFALTHFDNGDKAFVSREEYSDVLKNLVRHLERIAEDRPVYMPLFGTGLSRMHRTPQRILLHLVDILDFNDSSSILGGIHVLIKSLSKLDINLTTIEYIVNKGICETD